MMRISDHIRKSLLAKASTLDSNSLDKLIVSEWSEEFETLMRNRLIMGAFRYGKLKKARRPGATDFHINYIKEKLAIYEKTGNTDLSLVEFITGDHPLSHFKALDRE